MRDNAHSFRHAHVDAATPQAALELIGERGPSVDFGPAFAILGHDIPICDRAKVKLDEQQDAAGPQDAGKFMDKMRVVGDLSATSSAESRRVRRDAALVVGQEILTPAMMLRACTTSNELLSYGRQNVSRSQSSNLARAVVVSRCTGRWERQD